MPGEKLDKRVYSVNIYVLCIIISNQRRWHNSIVYAAMYPIAITLEMNALYGGCVGYLMKSMYVHAYKTRGSEDKFYHL